MPLIHCVSNTVKTSVSSGVTWNSQSRVLGPGGDQAVSSRPSDQRQRTPDGRACCDGNLARRIDGGWQNGTAGDWQLLTLGGQHSIRYCGALPWRHRCTVITSLWWIRSGRSSQCSSECSRWLKPRSNFWMCARHHWCVHNIRCVYITTDVCTTSLMCAHIRCVYITTDVCITSLMCAQHQMCVHHHWCVHDITDVCTTSDVCTSPLMCASHHWCVQ